MGGREAHWRSRRRAWMKHWLACAMLWCSACVGDRPRRCSMHSDCALDQAVCSARGYCQKECSAAGDCPCGSYCATGCGLCIRVDNRGPGTCFAIESGLSVEDALGVCAAHLEQRPSTQQDGGLCAPPQIEPLTCAPPIDVVTGGADAAPPQAPLEEDGGAQP